MLWRDYFRGLLLGRRIMLHLAIWVEDLEGLSKCELPDLNDVDDYPEIFKAVNMDRDGVKVRMSGMFGNATYERVLGIWTEIEYNARDNRLTERINPQALSWAT